MCMCTHTYMRITRMNIYKKSYTTIRVKCFKMSMLIKPQQAILCSANVVNIVEQNLHVETTHIVTAT